MESSSTSCIGSARGRGSLSVELSRNGVLRRTFEGSMEHEAPSADEQVAHEGDEKYLIMTLLSARLDANVGQVDK